MTPGSANRMKKRPPQERLVGLFTLLIIPGFLLATSIPSFAVSQDATGADGELAPVAPVTQADLQSVAVSSEAKVAVTREDFTAETHEQFVARKDAARIATARAGAYRTVGPAAAGDDYPWRASGGGLSPLGYVTRQCTDFVAWRLNRDRGTTGPFSLVWANMTPGGGSAGHWPSSWNSHGWQTSKTPIDGSVWYSGNHVAYVKSVNGDGTVTLEEYNWGGAASYGTRTVAASSATLYLYPPP